jgi:hypothetical protein
MYLSISYDFQNKHFLSAANGNDNCLQNLLEFKY